MITFVEGNIFESPAQVLTNAVNCGGVMGKGIALTFKKHYPAMFADYKMKCHANEVVVGKPYLWEDNRIQILNFPTKKHWRQKSELIYIEKGLQYLAKNYAHMGIYTIALPALGCANGGLNWHDVKKLMIKYLSDIPDLEAFVYTPNAAIKLSAGQGDFEGQLTPIIDSISTAFP